MTPQDRRHDDHPQPPDGVERRCSDEHCMEAREIWFEQTLLPRLMNKIYMTMAGVVLSLAGAFLYLSDNAITKFELKIKDEYESRSHHEEDIKRIERKFDSHSVDIVNRLDRNLEYIRQLQTGRK